MKKRYPLILVLVGLIIGLYWYQPITSYLNNWGLKPSKPIFCPSPDIVSANQNNSQSFIVDGKGWVIDYHSGLAPEKIGFMQALFENKNIICYYQWHNDQKPGTNLWMTIKLSPSVKDRISLYGSYWKDNLCTSGIEACAFQVYSE
jgi:hypothetical protein